MIWPLLILPLIASALPASADDRTDPPQRLARAVVETAAALESALPIAMQDEPAVQSLRERLRVRYVLVTDGPLSLNASVTLTEGDGRDADTQLGTRMLCGTPHSLGACQAERACQPSSATPVDATVLLGGRLLGEVCQEQPARIAFVLGHELAHLLLGHMALTNKHPGDVLDAACLAQSMEYAADEAGVRCALAAGFDNAVEAATAFWERMEQVRGERVPLEPGTSLASHPSATERIAELQRDPTRRQLWRALVSFDYGLSFLQLGNWLAAQGCFEAARKQFSQSPEVLVNLGYTKMMRYYSSLPRGERAKLGGEVSCLSFVTTHPPISGGAETDKTPLHEAIAHYEEALRIAPAMAIARAHLGTATLMDPDADLDHLRRAAELLDSAATAFQGSPADRALYDAIANHALVLSRIHPDRKDLFLREAAQRLPQGEAAWALKLNLGSALAESRDPRDLEWAESLLAGYMHQVPETSYYYSCAARDWIIVRRGLGKASVPLPAPTRVRWHSENSVLLSNGRTLYLGQQADAAEQALGEFGAKPVIGSPGETQRLIACPGIGLSVATYRGEVRALFLEAAEAPSVSLLGERFGGGGKLILRVGQKPQVVDEEVAKPAGSDELGLMVDPIRLRGQSYLFYRSVGIAVGWQGDRVARIALISS